MSKANGRFQDVENQIIKEFEKQTTPAPPNKKIYQWIVESVKDATEHCGSWEEVYGWLWPVVHCGHTYHGNLIRWFSNADIIGMFQHIDDFKVRMKIPKTLERLELKPPADGYDNTTGLVVHKLQEAGYQRQKTSMASRHAVYRPPPSAMSRGKYEPKRVYVPAKKGGCHEQSS